ncbi:hypothetical protein [Lyngbya aestuarii]|uniref:hypothetical protein n=1 Tax=Lyngbya aestuarii TaxID=118322 RepID=UPI00403DFEF4
MKLRDLDVLTKIDDDKKMTATVGGLQLPFPVSYDTSLSNQYSIRIDDCGNIVSGNFACVTYPCCLGPQQIPLGDQELLATL